MGDVETRPLTICAIGTGTSAHVATRVRWFAERGHRVFLLTPSPSPTGIEGVVEVELNYESPAFGQAWLRRLQDRLPRPSRGAVYYTLYAAAVLRAVRACRADIFHVYSASDSHGWIAGFLGCRPLVVTVMGSEVAPFEEQDHPTTAREWLTLRLLRQADYVTPPSDFLTGVLERLGGFRGEIERIIWGVSLERFRRRDASELRRTLGLRPRARVILSPKILRPFYRIHLIVEAMAVVRRTYPDAVLLVSEYAADPAYREQIARRIEELDLGENAVFSGGAIAHEDMPDYYSLAELSIAIPPKDGMPIALLESLACGTPQILSRLPRHEESAYFVEADPDAIAAAIIRLLQDEALRTRIAVQGRAVVAAKADLDEQAARVEKRFRELVATTRPRTVSVSALLSAVAAAAHLYVNYRLPRRRSRGPQPAADSHAGDQ
jgi:glycosyltransferase involved in cell wall biosynthesis